MIAVLGAGAFGTALAAAMAQGGKDVTLWARNRDAARQMNALGENRARLAGIALPDTLKITGDIASVKDAQYVLIACPAQQLPDLLRAYSQQLSSKTIVACSKGIDLETGLGPTGVISATLPNATPAILSGPSFAVDIGAGLPTALTLAMHDENEAKATQMTLATQSLRLYTSLDPIGVEIGGALKNVVAIACGVAIGANLGESARAALMTRGFAEMIRFAETRGAHATTLAGLSGFGDLALSAMSPKSRNYRFGLKLGAGEALPHETTEGIATAHAVAKIARAAGIEMPVALAVSDLLAGKTTPDQAIQALLARPVKGE